MLSPKEKLIEEAQKFLLKGQLDRAVKAYEQIVVLDPSTVGYRQRLADLLIKMGRQDDARRELEIIGSNYANGGFYLKAIAVYKQLQRQFPADVSISLIVADLNAKHGLTSNALNEYRQAYEHFAAAGDTAQVTSILERMHAVDPLNKGIILKLADALLRAGRNEESYSLLLKLGGILQQCGSEDELSRLQQRMAQLFPDRPGFMLEQLVLQVQEGRLEGAVLGLQTLLRQDPRNEKVWDLLIEVFQRLNMHDKVKAACLRSLQYVAPRTSTILILLKCLADESDVAGALSLLESHEGEIIAAGRGSELATIYRQLRQCEPENRLLSDGLARIRQVVGEEVLSAHNDAAAEEIPAVEEVLEQPFDLGWGEVDFTDEESSPALEAEEIVAQAEDAGLPSVFDLETPQLSDVDSAGHIEIEIEIDGEDWSAVDESMDESGDDEADSRLKSVFEDVGNHPAERTVRIGDELDSADVQTHFELGVAFREMGLYADALNEFRQAARDPQRAVECRSLEAACLRESGDFSASEELLSGLMSHKLDHAKTCIVKYELALTCEAVGSKEQARQLLQEVFDIEENFRDVKERLGAPPELPDLDFSDEDLQGFDLK